MNNNWQRKKLGDLAYYLNGRAFKPTEWEQHGRPIIRIQNLNKKSAPYNYTNQIFEDRYKVVKGDLLFAWSASLGVYIWKENDAWLNQHIFKVEPKDSVNKMFLFYLLEKLVLELYSKTHGSGMVHITKGKFEATEVFIPKLETQHAIVSKIEELFSELDQGIADLKTAQEQLKVYRQSVLKHAFEGKLTNKNVKEGKLPEGWETIKLDKVADIGSSKRIFQHEYVTNGIPFYRTKEVKELSEGKELSVELFISIEKYNEIKSKFKIPQIGDVLLSAVGTIGISYVIKNDKPFYFKDGNLMWFRDLKNINSYYLHYGLTNFIRNGQGANMSGSAYNALTISTMKDFDFPLPPIEEQHLIVQEIESRLSVADKMEESIQESLQKAEALRQSILKKAFSGELV